MTDNTDRIATPVTTPSAAVHAEWLGRVGYAEAWEHQRRIFRGVLAGDLPSTLLFCEHPDVITVGRNAVADASLRQSRGMLEQDGYEIFDVDRGGDVTYHGPGQLVGYPIIRLSDYREDLGWYIRSVEELVIRGLAGLSVEAGRISGITGVWIGNKKICAIGVRASRWVTMHGFAFNITTDLRRFGPIVPCGLEGYGVTSVLEQTGRAYKLEDVAESLAGLWSGVFGAHP